MEGRVSPGRKPMEELAKALAIALKGRPARAAVARFRRQLKAWGLAMPAVPPLVLDFGLGRFAEVGLIEYWIANEAAAGYCGKFLFVFDGQTCPLHQHRRKHETFFIVKGEVDMHFGPTRRRMRAGDVLPVATGHAHSFSGVGPALLLEVSMPCAIGDNYFADSAIPIGGNYRPPPPRAPRTRAAAPRRAHRKGTAGR